MRLRTLQKKKRMGNSEFAKFLGVSASWLSAYYYGKIRIPKSDLADRIIRRSGNLVTLRDLKSMAGRGPEFNRYA